MNDTGKHVINTQYANGFVFNLKDDRSVDLFLGEVVDGKPTGQKFLGNFYSMIVALKAAEDWKIIEKINIKWGW